MKRKHSPVQCERCYELFLGTDRSGCILRLEAHRQLETSCQRGDSALKEGISEAQWARLEGKRGTKAPQTVERVGRWFEIWDILFPQCNRPASPCQCAPIPKRGRSGLTRRPGYPEEASNKRPRKASVQTSSFMDLYRTIVDHKVQHHDIDFSSPEMRERIEAVAQVSFDMWIANNRVETSTNSSSSQRLQRSLLGGSSTHFSGQPNTSFSPYYPSHGSSGAQHSRASSFVFQPPFPPQTLAAGSPTVPDPRYPVPWTPTGSEYALAGSPMTAVPPFHMHPRRPAPISVEATFSRDPIDNWNPAGPFVDGHNFTLAQGPTEFQVPVTTGGIPNTFLEAPMDAMAEMDITNPMTFCHNT